MTVNLTYADVVKAGEEVVKEAGPDFVYAPIDTESYGSKCVYVNGASPSCAVGRILSKLGVPIDVLEAMDERDATDERVEIDADIPDVTFASADRLVAAGYLPDSLAFVYLGTFQERQDGGIPYGEAHSYALADVAEVTA